ncbi:hypothetical protein L210DRAFT_3756622 [Boletus edulis BED1]|uniref:Uncharacterized protein n=1 Tax=Boletus edulis BED1 TaxID=1328754 RepID=A0AAD4GJV3_BOLED|nr:hypothetical protein L210DRAFT_3756622 [Boletus edulis BED1]
MFPYKFATHSQKKDVNLIGAGFGTPFKRSNLDEKPNTPLSESTTKRMFDGGFSQSFSSRHPESYNLGGPAYPLLTPEVVDSKPPITALRTSSQLSSEPIGIGLNSRTFLSSTPSSKDSPKRIVKTNTQEPVQNTSVGEIEPKVFFAPMEANFRRLQNEWSQQREYITDLESQVVARNEVNTTLSRNLSQMETAHKQAMDKFRDALGRTTKNYSALKSEFDSFKLESESNSLLISEAKVTMESLAALRDSAQIGLRDLESMFDEDGRFILSAETRETVHELRSELSKTQQVADLLRDKLHSMGTELAEARARILELEELTTADRNRSESTSLKIRQSADQMIEVMRYLQEQKHESIQATAKVYEMEQQLVHTQTRLQEAQSVISSMREEMTAREELHEEQDAKLRTLRHTIDFQEGNAKDLEARARKAEEELIQTLNHNHELQGRLDSAKGLEKNLTQQASRLLSERDEVKEQLQSVERQLAEAQAREKTLSSDIAKILIERDALVDKLQFFDDIKREVNGYRETYAGCQVSLKVLQERFDDQCVALAASKESVGELQERLHATERQATETSIDSKREIIHLQEQNGVLKARLDHADKEIKDKIASYQALQIELSRKDGAFQALLETERLGKREAVDQVQEAKTKIELLLTELAEKDNHMQEMARQLATAEVPSTEREREAGALKVRIAELEATEKRLVDRAATISNRYENNDLNDDEKALVALIMRKARAIHDREMVEKTNEIKRRDSIIKQHDARIAQLENILARRIYESSVKSTDEQSNSVAVDTPMPQVPLSDHHPEIRGVGHEDPSTTTAHVVDGASVNQFIPGPSSRSNGHSTFSTLCREDTDDIANFEDEMPPVATGKRVMFAEVEDESLRPARRVVHLFVLSFVHLLLTASSWPLLLSALLFLA